MKHTLLCSLFAVGLLASASLHATAATAATAPEFAPAANQLQDEIAAVADAKWKVWGGRVGFRWNTHLLGDLGLQLLEHDTLGASKRADGLPEYAVRETSALDFGVRAGSFAGFTGGALTLRGGVELIGNKARASLRDMRLVARPGNPLVLDVVGNDGVAWLYVDRMMYVLEDERTPVLSFKTMDLRIAPALARMLGNEELVGLSVADMAMTTHVHSDKGDAAALFRAQTQAKGASNKWPGASVPGVPGATYQADVFMHDFYAVYKRRRAAADGPGGADSGVVFAPSSTLRNNRNNGSVRVTVPSMTPRGPGGGMPASDPLGTSSVLYSADIPWNTKFAAAQPPYDNDQHPFLIWNLFRIDASGRIDQIGRSGVKHAWLTTNSPCDVPSPGSYILGLGCADEYSDGNNDNLADLGPRSELVPAAGLWGRCGSVYDRDCNGSRDAQQPALPCSGAECAPFAYRLEVQESDIDPAANPGATYFFESWYIVREDINIFNTMQSRPVTFSWQSNIWNINNGLNNNLRLGPALDRWVSHAAPGTNRSSSQISDAGGHARVAVKVVDLGAAGYRYDYAVMNLDFARAVVSGSEPNLRVSSNDGFTAFSLPISAALPIDSYEFSDGDKNTANNWVATREGNRVVWRAPAATPNPLNWGTLYRFSITTAAPPVSATAVLTTALTPGVEEIQVSALLPQSDAVVTYVVGGMLDGLASGATVSLQLNNGSPLVLAADGAFVFENEVLDGGAYAVTVVASPVTQTCSVGNGSGTIDGADIVNVTVTCVDLPPPTYSIGGTAAGLSAAQSVTLQLNGSESLVRTGNGAFTFQTLLLSGAAYAVTVTQSPEGLSCTLSNAQGAVGSANVTNVQVVCAPIATYNIGGTVNGLASGGSLALQLNGGVALVRNGNGAFAFPDELPAGTPYAVTVATQPTLQRCDVMQGTGSVGSADVSNVVVTCTALPDHAVGGSLTGLTSGRSIGLRLNNGPGVVLTYNRTFEFRNRIIEGAAYEVTISSTPEGHTCSVTNASGVMGTSDISDVAVVCVVPQGEMFGDGFE